MSKVGRKSAYETKIKPRLSEIKEWTEEGANDTEISRRLNISKATFYKYLAEYKEFAEAVKSGRFKAVEKIENAMFESALGGKQTLKKAMKVKKILYKDGKKDKETEVMEPYEEEVYIAPNTTAGIFLLKHWAKDKGYTNDPLTLELKKQELELKKEIADHNNW